MLSIAWILIYYIVKVISRIAMDSDAKKVLMRWIASVFFQQANDSDTKPSLKILLRVEQYDLIEITNEQKAINDFSDKIA